MSTPVLKSIVAVFSMALSASLFAHGDHHRTLRCDEPESVQKLEEYIASEEYTCYRIELFCSAGIEGKLVVWGEANDTLEYELGLVNSDGDSCALLGEESCSPFGCSYRAGFNERTRQVSYSCFFENGERADFRIHQVKAKDCPED